MKKLILFAVLLLGFSAVSVAQDVPAFEVFGGYSYLRLEASGPDGHANLNGWDASLAVNGNSWIGFVADIGGLYKSDYDGIDIKLHNFLFGPKITLRRDMVTPFAQFLVGFGRWSVDDSDTGSELASDTDFAIGFGGGLDINVNDMLAIRPIQLEYLAIKEAGIEYSNNMRYSAGIVLKLGNR